MISQIIGTLLINHIAKLFTYMLNKRLEKWAKFPKVILETQAGFWERRGCNDNLFSILSAINIRLGQRQAKLYVLFVYFKRAFDSINYKLLWMKLLNMGVSAKLVRLLREMSCSVSFSVKCNGDCSSNFIVSEGVLQGKLLSPLLFILFISDIEDVFKANGCVGVTDSYDYLGLTATSSGFSRTTATNAINKACAALNMVNAIIFTNKIDSTEYIMKLFDSIVSATLL